MIFDIDMIREVYEDLPAKIKQVKEILQRPLTYTEKKFFFFPSLARCSG